MDKYKIAVECVYCHKIFEANLYHLINRHTRSCGCFKNRLCSIIGKNNSKHQLSNSRTYRSWSGMWQRCTNPKAPNTKYYKLRGITIHPEWGLFENFLRDMGERPKDMSLDRGDNDEGYEMLNCRWTTAKEQALNRRTTKYA